MFTVHRKIFLISLLANIFLLAVYLSRYDFDLSTLFAIPENSDQSQNPMLKQLSFFKNSGHDGGFVLSVALDPLHPNLDYTGHHFERILMPLILHVLSGGNLQKLLYLFPLFNILCLAILSWGMGKELERNKISPWWSLIISLGPWCLMPLRFNLINIFSNLIVWLGIMSFTRGKYFLFIMLGMMASITFPMTLIYFIIGNLFLFYNKKELKYLFFIPLILVPMFLYKVYLIWGLGLNINFLANDLLKSDSKKEAFSIYSFFQSFGAHFFQRNILRSGMALTSAIFYIYTMFVGLRLVVKEKGIKNIHGLICCTIPFLPFFVGGTIFANGMFQIGRFTFVYPSLLIISRDSLTRKISYLFLLFFAIVSVGWILFSPKM